MISAEVQRTLVKSPPELWSELSDLDSLTRHLGQFGEIRITRSRAEELIEWEAEDVRGQVSIKPSGWGTKVTLSATRETPAAPTPSSQPEAEPATPAAPAVPVAHEPEPRACSQPEAAPEPSSATAPELSPPRSRAADLAEPEPEPAPAEPAQSRAERAPLGDESAHTPAPVTEAGRRASGWPTGPDLPLEAPPAAGSDAPHGEPMSVSELRSELEREAPKQERRPGFFARLFGRRGGPPETAGEQVPDQLEEPSDPIAAPATIEAPDDPAVAEAAPAAPPELSRPASRISAPGEPAVQERGAEHEVEHEAPREPAAGSEEPPPAPEETTARAEEPTRRTADLAAELAAAEEVAAEEVRAVLTAVLDRLGAAHHRPFSRA